MVLNIQKIGSIAYILCYIYNIWKDIGGFRCQKKIIQIIPNNHNNLYAKFKLEGEITIKPIVCYALIEVEDINEVIPLCMNESGEIFNPIECDDFIEIVKI